MAVKVPFIPPFRLNSPWWQNFIMGTIIGLTAGLYQALNLLGAAGGRPNSFQTVQVVNATLCAVFAVSSWFGGSVLNTIGPAITAVLGVIGFAVYVASLWYFDHTGNEWFPILGGVMIGLSAGLIWVVQGSIAMSYSEEGERGSFIAIEVNLQATGCAIGDLIALIINRDSMEAAGVPTAYYIVLLAMMGCACLLALTLLPPSKVIRDDGSQVATLHARGYKQELKANLEIFKDWRLLLMVPAFLPSEAFLVYGGSVNAYHNDLRTRCLLSFSAVVIQIPAGFGLQKILDHKIWTRRKRAFLGLTTVGVPLMGAWIWEIIRVRNYDRSNPPSPPMDWTDGRFAAIFILFAMNWVSSILMQCIILYFLSCLTNSPVKAANYAGVYRGCLAAGEAIIFGLDSMAIPYIKEAGVIFTFYATGVLIFIYLGAVHVTETRYFNGEEGVIIPKHVVREHEHDLQLKLEDEGKAKENFDVEQNVVFEDNRG